MKVDILAFGAHPDDVEISAGATLAKQIALGNTCAIVDLTQGEMGTRGTVEIRAQEAANAAKVLGVSARENLKFRDGFFNNDEIHQLKVVQMIRKYQPEIVLANAPTDRHPDHGRGSEVVKTAMFLAGLQKVETSLDGVKQSAHRPRLLLQYIQFQNLQPQIILDVSGYLDIKMKAVMCYESQFYKEGSTEPQTVISGSNFTDSMEYRSRDMGRLIGCEHGEGFLSPQNIGLNDLMNLTSVR